MREAHYFGVGLFAIIGTSLYCVIRYGEMLPAFVRGFCGS